MPCLAYIAISLDATGLLRYLALHVSLKGGRSGPRLFYLLYAFFFILGLLVGNDPVILSGTAFLVHFTRISGISRPDAWIWAQFSAANISSALLVSSNPTNIVIASGFGVTFTTYSAFMALPTIASGLTALVVVRLIFLTQKAGRWSLMGLLMPGANRSVKSEKGKDKGAQQVEATAVDSTITPGVEGEASPSTPPSLRSRQERSTSPARDIVYIPPFLIPPDVRPRDALVDPFGAIFGSIVMAATLIVLVGTSVTGTVEVYEIALPGAAICLLRDILKDLKDGRTERQEKQKAMTRQRVAERVLPVTGAPEEAIEMQEVESATAQTGELDHPPASTIASSGASFEPGRAQVLVNKALTFPSWFAKTFPTVTAVFSRLPLPLLPFAFGMFILVESLAHVGFIDIMAGGLGKVCAGAGEIGTALFIGSLSVVMCNVSKEQAERCSMGAGIDDASASRSTAGRHEHRSLHHPGPGDNLSAFLTKPLAGGLGQHHTDCHLCSRAGVQRRGSRRDFRRLTCRPTLEGESAPGRNSVKSEAHCHLVCAHRTSGSLEWPDRRVGTGPER